MGYRPGWTIEGTDLDGQGRRIEVSSPGGSRSLSVMRPEGTVQVDVQSPVDVGRAGEAQVCTTLVSALQSQRTHVSWRPGDDARGEDGVLLFPSGKVPLQIVTVPTAPEFWHEVALGSATTQVSLNQAARWIHDAVADKSGSLSTSQKAATLLGVDAHHAGVLATPEIIATYLSEYPEPQQEFGFGAVWVVGPTTSSTTRLGKGRW